MRVSVKECKMCRRVEQKAVILLTVYRYQFFAEFAENGCGDLPRVYSRDALSFRR